MVNFLLALRLRAFYKPPDARVRVVFVYDQLLGRQSGRITSITESTKKEVNRRGLKRGRDRGTALSPSTAQPPTPDRIIFCPASPFHPIIRLFPPVKEPGPRIGTFEKFNIKESASQN